MTERVKGICPACAFEWDLCTCSSWQLRHFLYSRVQVFWLVAHEFTPPWASSGSLSERVNTSEIGGRAPSPDIDIIAEVKARIDKCGEAGEALVDEAPNVEFISQLSRPARRALNYCSGYRRRMLTYSEWKRRAEKSQNTTSPEIVHA